ncbi:TetR/AcrR family transcriptional regulator [Streptomyces sp. NPDC050560]|uniref:TetR/AcrR family transcriptional regulator n=1 Tax=Streptomyces sp. NPDC050560 TaxID=3365630 RepID=UPI0037BC5F12
MVNGTARGAETRSGRGAGTREAIMAAAERLYAEHGLSAVSNRQIAEAAGQGNTTVVSYHFGSKPALVRSLMTRHDTMIDAIRQRHVAAVGEGGDVRDWVWCMVRPVTEHLDALGVPSWLARCAEQVLADPLLRALVTDESLTRDSLWRTLRGLSRCLGPTVPAAVRRERGDMVRHLIIHTCAEQERALADGTARPGASWQRTAESLEDALVGLLTAPTTRG